MGRLYLKYLDCKNMYTCKKCQTNFADKETLISKNFWGASGQAYLFG